MGEILDTLRAMERMQYSLLLLFLTSYTLSLGALFDASGRRASAGVALLSAGGFVGFTDPWYHGVLLMAAVVGVVGAFVLAIWLIAYALGRSNRAAAPLIATDMEADAFSHDLSARSSNEVNDEVGASVAPS